MERRKWLVPLFVLAIAFVLQVTPILASGGVPVYGDGSEVTPVHGTMLSRG
ncbi:MAG: hypothetical protein JNM70_24080 [Anaerolineae bacterium]|nr:hypothetical protein [Anaerolineae bacterium]